jgi:HSP20 family molecular chaperone IbpA
MAERASVSHQSSRNIGNPASSAITLRLVEPEAINSRINELYDAIARRAFEIFEGDGRVSGRELDHWFRAEAELLHPSHVQVREADDAIIVDTEVPGFSANELKVSLEPHRLTISGQKQGSREEKKGNVLYSERCSNELLRSIELPVEVNASRATATLNNGILELNAPKLAGKNAAIQARSAGAA